MSSTDGAGLELVLRASREGLLLVLLLIESTDLVFAIDSIPAIYAVTDDPLIVFTSNVFAILGLRALYFVLNGYLAGLRYLKPALAAILIFVGGKMVLTGSRPPAQAGAMDVVHRITWEKKSDDEVRQLWESSPDGGQTWSVVFDGKYVRRKG